MCVLLGYCVLLLLTSLHLIKVVLHTLEAPLIMHDLILHLLPQIEVVLSRCPIIKRGVRGGPCEGACVLLLT